MKTLSKTLAALKNITPKDKKALEDEIKDLQLKMLRVQQGVWHAKKRVIIVFEGFDTAGKGGAIRALTETLDPRGVRVHPVGPPTEEEQGKHWLYRFWRDLPAPGDIAIFDRSWYGRVLVERVDELIPKKRWKDAFEEINQFEKVLQDDGVMILKFFLAISKEEQLQRLEARLKDPYKQWKISMDDIKARQKWDDYVLAVDEMLKKTNTKNCPWNLIATNEKKLARKEILTITTSELHSHADWIEAQATKLGVRKLEKALREKLS